MSDLFNRIYQRLTRDLAPGARSEIPPPLPDTPVGAVVITPDGRPPIDPPTFQPVDADTLRIDAQNRQRDLDEARADDQARHERFAEH